MYTLLCLGFLSFSLCMLLTPQVRNLFRMLNIVDGPDNIRKIHRESIPRVGGIAIVVSYVVALAVLALSPLGGGSWARGHAWGAAILLPAILVVFGCGLLDDLFVLKPREKLLIQVVASLLA